MDVTEQNVRIAEALGLDPERIRKGGVRITLDGHLGPVVEVQYRATDSVADAFVTELGRYRLVPLEDEA